MWFVSPLVSRTPKWCWDTGDTRHTQRTGHHGPCRQSRFYFCSGVQALSVCAQVQNLGGKPCRQRKFGMHTAPQSFLWATQDTHIEIFEMHLRGMSGMGGGGSLVPMDWQVRVHLGSPRRRFLSPDCSSGSSRKLQSTATVVALLPSEKSCPFLF